MYFHQTTKLLLQEIRLYNEELLLKSLSQGDEQAFTALFAHYRQQVFSVAMLYLKEEIEAKEVVQDVFLKIWMKRESLAAIESFKDYLFIIVRNHIYVNLRRLAISKVKLEEYGQRLPVDVNDTDHIVQDKQYQEFLQQAIEQLPNARKRVYLARSAGVSYEEIASAMNISVHTVKKQMQLANQFIRVQVAQFMNDQIPALVWLTLCAYASEKGIA